MKCLGFGFFGLLFSFSFFSIAAEETDLDFETSFGCYYCMARCSCPIGSGGIETTGQYYIKEKKKKVKVTSSFDCRKLYDGTACSASFSQGWGKPRRVRHDCTRDTLVAYKCSWLKSDDEE